MKKLIHAGITSLFLLFSISLLAHGDLDERIQQVSEEIKSAPENGELYYKRGVLFFQHEEYKHSIRDLRKARSKGFSDVLLDLHLSKDYKALKKYKKASRLLNEILEEDSHNVHALKTLGQIAFERKQFEKAALLLHQVIEVTIRAFPENYIDAAKAYASAENKTMNRKAIELLKNGIEDLGPAIVFYEEIRRLSLRDKNYHEAIWAQEEILKLLDRKESAYYQLAELYFAKGEEAFGIQYLFAAKNELKKLPQRIRKTIAMMALEQKIQNHLN